MIISQQRNSSNLPFSGQDGEIFVTITDERSLFTVYYEEYARNMIVSLRNNNSRWVYSIYLDAKGWIDIDLFAEDELAESQKIFVIDGPLLIVAFTTHIRVFPIDIDANYLQYSIPLDWRLKTVSSMTLCKHRYCVIEWNSTSLPRFWTFISIPKCLNLFSETIISLSFSQENVVSDGLWAALFSPTPIPSTLPFSPTSLFSQLQPNQSLVLDSLSAPQPFSIKCLAITSHKISDIPTNSRSHCYIDSIYSDNIGNVNKSVYQLSKSDGGKWTECICLAQTQANLFDQLRIYHNFSSSVEADQLIFTQLDQLYFSANSVNSPTSTPSILIIGMNLKNENKNSMILLLSSVTLTILSVFSSVDQYCFHSSPKFGHRIYMVPSSGNVETGISSLHSSCYLSSAQFSHPAANIGHHDYQLIACDLIPEQCTHEASIIRKTEGVLSTCAVSLPSSRLGIIFDTISDILHRDPSKSEGKPKKKRKRETSRSESAKNRKTTLSELEIEKQLMMKTALQTRLYSSTDAVVQLLNLHKRKCEMLCGLMILCKNTIQTLIPTGRIKAIKSNKYQTVCDILISDNYRPLFPLETTSTKIPEILPTQTIKTTTSRKLGLRQNVQSVPPRLTSNASVRTERHPERTGEMIHIPEQRRTQDSIEPPSASQTQIKVIGTFARRISEQSLIILVCLKNPTRTSLYNLSLQAEAIASSESYFAYLEDKYHAETLLQGRFPGFHRCHNISSSISELLPEASAILFAKLTVYPISSVAIHRQSTDATRICQSRAIQRILRLHGGISKAPASVLVGLSTFIDIRLKYYDEVSSESRTLPLPKLQFEESPTFPPTLHYSNSQFLSIGILPILPEFNAEYSHESYSKECQSNFFPHTIIPVYDSADEKGMWDQLRNILSCQRHCSVYGILPLPSSYRLISYSENLSRMNRLNEILSSYSSSITVSDFISSHRRELELSFPELFINHRSQQPQFFLTSLSSDGTNSLLHIFPSLRALSSPNYLLNLRYDLLSTCQFEIIPTKLTKGAVYQLFRSMEYALQTLIETIKISAIIWREFNLFQQQERQNTQRNLTSKKEKRIFLSSRLWTTIPKLYEDLLYSQYLCDQAMVSFLVTLQDYRQRE